MQRGLKVYFVIMVRVKVRDGLNAKRIESLTLSSYPSHHLDARLNAKRIERASGLWLIEWC
jgi:hypothetical protein